MLNIIVCVKVVTDPEAPVSTFKSDPEGKSVLPGIGVPPVNNPYDENALEAALKIKESKSAKITIISAAKTVPKAVIKKCLAVGADDLVLIEDEVLDNTDSYVTASLLAAAIKKLGAFDLILTGRMASDTNAGQVGQGIAEILGIPVTTDARKVEVTEGMVKTERIKTDGYDIIETVLPCLVTVSNEVGELRQANVRSLMAAQKQPFTTWKIADLGFNAPVIKRKHIQKLFIPDREVNCEIISGETFEESGELLAKRLRESGLL
jgi:electron transfer flavoprotein beta subunit